MAITTVKGKVTRTFHNGTGAEISETFQVRGEPITKRWSTWFEAAHGLTEGQEVEVSGLHSDTVDAWETKEGETRHTVKRSLNKSRVVSQQPSAAPSSPQQDSWAPSPAGPSDESLLPF